MTDRELLEKAAKAAGFAFSVAPQESDYGRCDWGEEISHANGKPWNPLTDDGDALRLAVRLRLYVRCQAHAVRVRVKDQSAAVMERLDDGAEAATRRAIVRAAAALADSTSAKSCA